jgi:adenylate cyclase
MALEIERKFLVKGDFRNDVAEAVHIVQAYISALPERTVRIRIRGDRGYITIKGRADSSGVVRYEWEKEIPLSEAEELLLLCGPGVIEKTRHIIKAGKHLFEVDEFHGENEGLIIAEIELSSADEQFMKPSWLGKEVTSESKYYNSSLSRKPFKSW